MILNKDSILATVPNLTRILVEVPEWKGSVWVRCLRSGEKDALERKWSDTKNKHFRARLVAAVCCDEKGEKLFNETDIVALAQHSATALEPVFTAAMRLNGWDKSDIETLDKSEANGEATP